MSKNFYFYVKNEKAFIDRYFMDIGKIYVHYYMVAEKGLAYQDASQYTKGEVAKEYKKYVKNPDSWLNNYYYDKKN